VAGDTVYSVAREPFELTGVTVRAQTGATGRPVLLLTFDTTTAGKLKEYTTDNVGKTVAISDGLQVISAPVINEPIVTSSLQLSGPDSAAENKAVAARMTLAALRIEIRRG
jgi:preprotein translocase subunit SecD